MRLRDLGHRENTTTSKRKRASVSNIDIIVENGGNSGQSRCPGRRVTVEESAPEGEPSQGESGDVTAGATARSGVADKNHKQSGVNAVVQAKRMDQLSMPLKHRTAEKNPKARRQRAPLIVFGRLVGAEDDDSHITGEALLPRRVSISQENTPQSDSPNLPRRVSISQENTPQSDSPNQNDNNPTPESDSPNQDDDNPTAEVTEPSLMGDDGDMERDGDQDDPDPKEWEDDLSGDDDDDDKDEERAVMDISERARRQADEIARVVARCSAKKKLEGAAFGMICAEVRGKVKHMVFASGLFAFRSAEEVKGAVYHIINELGYLGRVPLSDIACRTKEQIRDRKALLSIVKDTVSQVGRDFRHEVRKKLRALLVLEELQPRPYAYIDAENLDEMKAWIEDDFIKACAQGSLKGIRDDYNLMLSLHELCTSVFSQLPASLAQHRLLPGDLIGNTVTVAMEAMVRVEMWAYFAGWTCHDLNAKKGRGQRFNGFSEGYLERYRSIVKDVTEGRKKSLEMDRQVAGAVANGDDAGMESEEESDGNNDPFCYKRDSLSSEARGMAEFLSRTPMI